MEIPRFTVGSFNDRIAGSDAGKAFQAFAGEILLKRYPGIHVYQTAGRDGAIDLDTPAQVVIECKHTDGNEVQKAWDEVAKRLERHLLDPAGPGQSQYAPWYATGADAIACYVLATDAEFPNKSRRSQLRNDISAFFRRLAKESHLAHLKKLTVEVLDWSDFESELKARPDLVFRWFPSTRPTGLMPLDDAQESRFFRAFLSEATLPYYSRAEHAVATGLVVPGAPREPELLALLDRKTGLIITGKGGIGKTRLTLELGRRARQTGWLVLRASPTFREEAIGDLLSRFVVPTDVLLLIDYVEMIPTFADRIEHIEMLNATLPHRIRYVANCRTTYYRNVQAIGGHERLDVSPAAGQPTSWLDGYRRTIIERVLSSAGIEITPAHLQVCRDVPVLAVFMAYLQGLRRTNDLHELVTDGEFGTWIARRIQQSFGRPIAKDLAMLVAGFPMYEAQRKALSPRLTELFERLAADGWIEQVTDGPDAGQWVTAHDALADRVILNHIENLGAALLPFIQELLDFAEVIPTIGSVMIALQRLAESAELQALDWVGIFAERLNSRAPRWLAMRTSILRYNLIPATERIKLLERTPEIWEELVADTSFQVSLGWICKQVTEAAGSVPSETLKNWVLKAAAENNRLSYLIARGLVLFPEMQSAAQRWLELHRAEFHSQYVLVAWLDRGHGCSAVMPHVTAWIEKFATAEQASFVYRAWLDAGGDSALVKEPIERWFTQHAEGKNAQFVYRAWLGAGGGSSFVKEAIDRWLVTHAEVEVASFVYQAWLGAGGELSFVKEAIDRWLVKHAEVEGASFVYRGWLDAGGKSSLVEEAIERWLVKYGEAEAAQFVYRGWLDSGGRFSLVEEPIKRWLVVHAEVEGASFVYRGWLDAGGKSSLVEEAIERWLVKYGEAEAAQFLYRAWLDSGGGFSLVEESIKRWLVKHAEAEVAQFVYRAWLDAAGEISLVEQSIKRWLVRQGEVENAQFVYCAWLDARGRPSLVEEPVERWLAKHAEVEAAQFVYRAWLDAGGQHSLVEESIARWLVKHAEAEAAQFVYRGWLDARGRSSLVEEAIERWLARHAETEAAQFVYRAWLDAGGELGFVQKPIGYWLRLHGSIESAAFVYTGWLNAAGALEPIESYLVDWFRLHSESIDVDFLVVAYLKRGGPFEPVRHAALVSMTRLRERPDGAFLSKVLARERDLPNEAVLDILAWCRRYSDDEDALWRLSQLQYKITRFAVVAEAFDVAELVLNRWLTPTSVLPRDMANNVAHVLAALTSIETPELRIRIDAMVVRWLRHPVGVRASDWCRRGLVLPLISTVDALLGRGVITLAGDSAALDQFVLWAQRCDELFSKHLGSLPIWVRERVPVN